MRGVNEGAGLHIAIEAVGAKHSGAARVLEQVVAGCLAEPRLKRLSVYSSARRALVMELPNDPRLELLEQPAADTSRVRRIEWYEVGFRRALTRLRPHVALCVNALGTPAADIPTVALVQQSLPFSREALDRCGPATHVRMAMLRWTMDRCVARAAEVIVQTPTMRRWVRDAFGKSEGRIRVILPEAPDLSLACEPRTPRLREMIGRTQSLSVLYVGNASPYKNLGTLREAMRFLRSSLPDVRCFATLPPGHSLCQDGSITAIGSLDRDDLAAAYGLADVFVMPSLVETVGLPMLEAMRAGVPVLAADRPYARDVCGAAAEFFDPCDPRHLARQLRHILTSTIDRDRLRHAGLERTTQLHASAPMRQLTEVLMNVADRGGHTR
jgi:glycosyltransferase involved in cell wall biosynthesis